MKRFLNDVASNKAGELSLEEKIERL